MSKDSQAWKKERVEWQKSPIAKRKADIEKIIAYREGMRGNRRDYELKDPSPKRKRALADLEYATKTMRAAGWRTERNAYMAHKMYMDDTVLILYRAIRNAINAGLTDHPLVRDWISNQRTFGEWNILRPFKRMRLEKGVNRPPPNEDFWVRFEAQSLSDDGYGPQEIRKELIKKLLKNDVPDFFGLTKSDLNKLRMHLAGMSRQGFRQKLIRLGWCPPQKKT